MFKSLSKPTAILFPKLLKGFVSIDPVNVRAKFEVRSFTRSWDNRGYLKTLGSLWIRPCSLFSQIFNGLWPLVRMDAMNVTAKFAVRSFTRSWDNSDWSFGWGLRTRKIEEEEGVGVGDATVRKSVGEFLYIGPPFHSNFSSTFTRFRDCRFSAPARHFFPTPPLSPKNFLRRAKVLG